MGIDLKRGKGSKAVWVAHKNLIGGVAKRVKVDEHLDFPRQTQEGGTHYVLQIPRQGLHVITRFSGF